MDQKITPKAPDPKKTPCRNDITRKIKTIEKNIMCNQMVTSEIIPLFHEYTI